MNSRPWALAFVIVLSLSAFFYLMMGLAGRAEGPKEFQLEEFGRFPVVDHGRVKPLDTLARVSLMILSGKQEYTDAADKDQPALRWLLDVMTASMKQRPTEGRPIAGDSRDTEAYRVEDVGLRQMLKLDDKKATVFSFQQIYDAAGPEGLKTLFRKAGDLTTVEGEELNDRDRALVDLAAQLRWHLQYSAYETTHRIFRIENHQVLTVLGLEGRDGYRYGFDEILPRLGHLEREAQRAHRVGQKNRTVYEQKAYETFKHVELYVGLARGNADTLALVAPAFKNGEFLVLADAREALHDALEREANRETAFRAFPTTVIFEQILRSYAADDKADFNKFVGTYQKVVSEALPNETATASMESSFNAFAPFYRGEVLYVMVFVVACLSWLWRDVLINRFAFWFMFATLLLHTWALIMRMYIQGRPPVTNLYSSAVFIGWACVVFCLFFELRFRNAVATAVGALTGFATLLIAHYLGGSGDTLEMMQAVLDTNFWLATHVTTVTIGYSATFVAGVFGIFFLWQMMVTSVLNSLREGGPISSGRLTMFLVSAMAAAVLAATLATLILYGLWFRSGKSPAMRHVVMGMGVVLLLAGLGYAAYLVIQRMRLVGVSKPNGLPPGTYCLEPLAMTDTSRKILSWMIYGIVCFGMLFSFVGTVLGGIWADQSWGRFWGWDPKENGAVLIVIMNALILHARWGGMVQERGMATLAIVGNMITMWSWFGTNQLQTGLHSYGFSSALVDLCRWFWVSQLVLIGLAMMPLVNWRTYTPLVAEPATSPIQVPQKIKGKRGGAGIQPA